MKKRLLSLALVLAMALTLLPTAAFAAGCSHDSVDAAALASSYREVTAVTPAADRSCADGFVSALPEMQEGAKLYQCTAEGGCGKYFTIKEDPEAPGAYVQPILFSGADGVVQPGTPHTWKETPDGTCTKCSFQCKNHTPAANNDGAAQYTQDQSAEKHSFTCQTCAAAVTEVCSYTNGAEGSKTCVCGRAEPAGPVVLTVAVSGASQQANSKTIHLTVTVTAEGEMPPAALKSALAAVTALLPSAGADAAVTLGAIDSTKSQNGKAVISASFTMPDAMPSSPDSQNISFSIVPAAGYTLAGGSFVEAPLASYVKPSNLTPITAFTISAPAKIEAKGHVRFAIAGATAGGAASDDAKAALDIAGITWRQNGADLDPQPLTAMAPAAGAYTVVATASVREGSAFSIENTVKAELEVTVIPAPTTPVTPPKPTVPETPKDENKIPSTNSQGIPLASEVSTSKQAQAAVNILKNTNAGVLQERLMTSESAASSFRSLERAVMSAKNIGVQVEVDRNAVPSAVRSGVDIDGAAFNAASSNTTVRLVVDAPSRAYYSFSGYQISMTLTGVPSAASLDVPVVITLPLPSDVSAGRVVVLHYHNGSSTPTAIIPAVSGNSIRFPVTGFSDFVVTDRDNSWSGPAGGGYLGRNVRKDNTDLSVILAIAAMLSGDGVFVDVPGDHWAAREIRWARDGGLMSGYEDGSFRPYATSTRQELWMVLARLAGARPADMAAAREWAVRTGVSDGSNPHSALSRQQLVTMLYRFAGSQGVRVSASANLGSYADGRAVASYAKDAFSWAVAKGIVGGDSNGRLNPEGTATRAHFAVLLCRYSSNGTT